MQPRITDSNNFWRQITSSKDNIPILISFSTCNIIYTQIYIYTHTYTYMINLFSNFSFIFPHLKIRSQLSLLFLHLFPSFKWNHYKRPFSSTNCPQITKTFCTLITYFKRAYILSKNSKIVNLSCLVHFS